MQTVGRRIIWREACNERSKASSHNSNAPMITSRVRPGQTQSNERICSSTTSNNNRPLAKQTPPIRDKSRRAPEEGRERWSESAQPRPDVVGSSSGSSNASRNGYMTMSSNLWSNGMSLQEFVERAVAENREQVEEITTLRQILDSLREHRRTPRIYVVSVTSNT